MPKYSIGDQEFRTKTEAVAKIKDLLWGTPLGASVSDQTIMAALIAQHPAAGTKLAHGIAAVEVHPDDWGSRGFRIRTLTGELISFSYRECFNPSTRRQNIMTALRREVAGQINEFRFGVTPACALTGVALTHERGLPNSSEVDHIAPETFMALADRWIAMQGGVDLIPYASRGQLPYLADDAQSHSWQTFHGLHARLRLLAASAHRALPRG